MNFVRTCALLSVLMMVPLAASQAAGLYKWTDEEGTVHYGQLPPTDRAATKLAPPKDIPPTSQNAQQQTDETAIPEEAKRNAEALKVKSQNCEIAKGNMQTYKDYTHIRQPDGSVLELSDEMREAKIQETQVMIDKYCN